MKPRDPEPLTPLRSVRGSVSILGFLSGASNFTTVQRLVAQQAVTQASLDQLRAHGEAWRAASVLSGLTLEEQWPVRLAEPSPKVGPDPAPPAKRNPPVSTECKP